MENRMWRQFRRNRMALVGLILTVVICAVSMAAPVLAPIPYDAQLISSGLTELGAPAPPGTQVDETLADGRHYTGRLTLGADRMGRSVLSRLLWGSQISLVVGLAATLISVVIGLTIGIVSGYFGGRVDAILQRFTDFVLSFPYLLFVIALSTVLRQNDAITQALSRLRVTLTHSVHESVGNLVPSFVVLLAIGLLGWTTSARVVRGKTLALREKEFVEAARALGAHSSYIIVRHVLPNVIGPLTVIATMGVAGAILAESTLSYLGLGVPQPIPSWGNMIQEGQPYFRNAPWLVIWPGLCIVFVVLGFNLLGDGLRDVMDPREYRVGETISLPVLRWLWLAPATLVAIALGSALGSDTYYRPIRPTPTDEPLYGGVLRTSINDSLRSLDPAIAYDAESAMAERLLYNALIDYDEDANLIPGVATRWEVSADGLTYTFHLRDNVRFHNGRPCTAADYKYSIERLLKPQTGSPGAPFYEVVVGAEAVMKGEQQEASGIEVPDPLTIIFHLQEPRPVFLNIIAMPFGAAVPREEVERWGESFTQHPVGTGPFRLKEWKQGQHISFERFDQYWDPRLPYLDGVVADENVSRELSFLRFQQGEYDTLYRITSPDYLFMKTAPEWSDAMVTRPAADVFADLLNTRMPPFDNKLVRQAFNWAVNKEKLLKLRNGRAVIANGVIPPVVPGFNAGLKGYGYDPAKARELLAQAGYAHGIDVPVEYWHLNDEASSQTAQAIQADLAAVGVRVDLKPVTFPAYLSAVGRPKTVQYAYTAWIQDYPDPSNFLETKFHGRYIADENSSNDTYVDNPVLNDLLDRAARELDHETRMRLYQEAERIVVDEAYWVFQYHSVENEPTQPYVQGKHGYHIHPVWPRNYRDVAMRARLDGVAIANQRSVP
ncbi:MAG: ABC transporter permease subunit [Candidatus Schekmanbacteria bacterium]|nr:ABC transporter permease subunit [Candidatus Schekmanbacteria bacterium]